MSPGDHHLVQIYRSWPRMLNDAYNSSIEILTNNYPWFEPVIDVQPRLVIGCGMGGSAYSLATSFTFLDEAPVKIPYHVNMSPNLPKYVDSRDYVIAVSYSGETTETLNCAVEALNRNVNMAVIAGKSSTLYSLGGRKVVRIGVETDTTARASLAKLVGLVYGVLGGERAEEYVRSTVHDINVERAERVALWFYELMRGREKPVVPLLVSCGLGGLIVRRWVDELAENAKIPSLFEVYPEAGHNKVMRWSNGRVIPNIVVIYFDVGGDSVCERTKYFVLEAYKKFAEVYLVDEWSTPRSTKAAILLEAAMSAGIASVLLALSRRVDPTPTPHIDHYRRVIRKSRDNK